jgi:UrcA family protein
MEADMFRPEYTRTLAALAMIGTAVMLAPTSAVASPTSEVSHSAVVRFADLDTSKPADIERLYVRIKQAAQSVCRNYQWSPVQVDCYEAAVADAVAKVHQPLLSALVERHGATAHVSRARA